MKAVCVISAGFAETGAEGAARQDELLALVRAHGARLVGPNCLGIAATRRAAQRDVRAPLAAARTRRLLLAERRARACAPRASRRARPRPLVVRLDRQQGRCLLERPPRVLGGRRRDRPDPALPRVVREPAQVRARRRTGRALEADPRDAKRDEPRRCACGELAHGSARGLGRRRRSALLAGRRAARAHAGGAARHRRAPLLTTASARQPGRRAHERRRPRHPLRRRLRRRRARAAAARRRDPGCAAQASMPVEASVANPVDLLGSATADVYEAALPALLADPGIDAVIASSSRRSSRPPTTSPPRSHAASAGSDKPVLPVVMSAEGTSVGGFAYPESAARALGLAARRAAWLRRPAGAVPVLDRHRSERRRGRSIEAALATADDLWLDPAETRALLTRLRPPARRGALRRDARTTRSARPTSSATRSSSRRPPRVRTRPRSGGVHVDLRDDASVRTAAEQIGGPVIVQTVRAGRRRAARGRDPGPGVRAARRVRPGRRLAELIGSAATRARAAHRRRRRRARRQRQGRPAGCRVARSRTGRQGRA